MKESLQNLTDLVVKPNAVFTRLKSDPNWVLAFVVYCSVGIVLLWLIEPFTQELIQQQIVSQQKTGDDIKVTSFEAYLARGLITLILWCILLSAILTLAARAFNIKKTLKFKHIYAGTVHASLMGTLIYFINASILPIFRKVEDMESTIDLKIIPGLHLLASSIENDELLTFLSHINPLSVWYVGVFAAGISIMAERSNTKACIVALIIWFLRVGSEVAFLAVSLD